MTAPRDEAVREAWEGVVMCYHPSNFSEAEFLERLAILLAKGRAAAFAEAGRVVEGLPAFDYTSEGMERAVPQHYGDYIDRDDALTALAALRDAAQQGGNDGK